MLNLCHHTRSQRGPPLLLTWVLGVGFDHPINWLLALFCAGLIAAVVESLVLAFGFSHVAWKKAFRLVLLVNLVCVSLAVSRTPLICALIHHKLTCVPRVACVGSP